MTLRQLLLSGQMNEIKQFFGNTQGEVQKILVALTLHIQNFPEEFRTKEVFLEELDVLQVEKDFSDFTPAMQSAFARMSQKEDWEEIINSAKGVIKAC